MSELGIVLAFGEEAIFHVGDKVRISDRSPIGHYRMPAYLRGKAGTVEAVMPAGIDNEQEGYGRNAGKKLHYYRIAIPMTDIWAIINAAESMNSLKISLTRHENSFRPALLGTNE